MNDLELAQQARDEAKVDAAVDAYIESKLGKVHLAAPISAPAKVKLRGILKHYAREPHPFRSCVKDNMKRFGPGRVEAVCGTLKAEIKHKGLAAAKASTAKLSDADLRIDGEVLLALDALSEVDLMEVFMEARALDEHGTVEGVALLEVSGRSELERWGGRP